MLKRVSQDIDPDEHNGEIGGQKTLLSLENSSVRPGGDGDEGEDERVSGQRLKIWPQNSVKTIKKLPYWD